MHSLLESYLSELAAQLQALPQARRAEELREMRTHLESAQTEYRAQGQTGDEAAASAAAQFGSPDALAQSVTQAWRRGAAIRRRELGLSAVCTFLLAFLLPKLLFPLVKSSLLPLDNLHKADLSLLLYLSFSLFAGLVNGFLLPRRAVVGTAWGMSVKTIYLCGMMVFVHPQFAHYWQTDQTYAAFILVSWGITSAAGALLAMLGAWLGSRGGGQAARLVGSR